MAIMVIPAVDIRDGKAVRLIQGRPENQTVYGDDPIEMALRWQSKGAKRIHVVDLDAAICGSQSNREIIRQMASELDVPIEVGGGIRDKDTVDYYLGSGVEYVILGTIVFEAPEVFEKISKLYPGKIIVSLDAKQGKVSVRGWTKDLEVDVAEVLKEYENYPISAIIYTDILRDGMKTGPNFQMVKKILDKSPFPLILAGGVRDIGHIREAMELERYGLVGVITGKAIYDGTLDLGEAIQVTEGESHVRRTDQ